MKIKALIVLFAFIFDSVIALLFPNSFMLTTFAFVANAGFLATLLLIYKKDLMDQVLIAGLVGILYGIFFDISPLLYYVIYALIALLVHFWERHLMDSFFEKLMLLVSTLFIKDMVLFVIYYIFFDYKVNVEEWFVLREFLTILGNAIIAMGLIFIFQWADDYLEVKERKLRKTERIHVIK